MENTLITNQKKRRKGFTLIELIIVLAVMAIIAAIAIPNFSAVSKNSKNKADVQSAETIERAVLMLVSDGTVKSELKTYTVAFPQSGMTVTELGKTEGAGETSAETAIKEALKDVKKPQGIKFDKITEGKGNHGTESATQYFIKVDAQGNVLVNTSGTFN